ncbi:2-polyprenyl-6-methoxyphenol hydroxylase-like oxidoreductase [Shewanella psychrophila]|uniref:2-polyprenyl-6-methoxyphenol hydroxylase-like oxidoreductase n=1 Tax=Shewanella psychrophila TaxID=225848 RepID=A0A1S6HIU2_9GAMM|nr:FAD-dependent monooxygenase [Shewanella psychrophila]AQS35435.1 2-polyprenyl-6-methoxyphenol hydroxylase-like oxidoreductase [Shewanella psychrophila]
MEQTSQICIVGGGPAGLVLALKLAKSGVDVTVLEANKSYERSFRGESIQPDTVGIFHELGIADAINEHGYMIFKELEVWERDSKRLNMNYTKMPYQHKFMIDVPQPVFLNALAEKLAQYPNAKLIRGAAFDGVIEKDDTVIGVTYREAGEKKSIHAKAIIAADGRYSRVREKAAIPYTKTPQERDVLWCKMPIPEGWDKHKYYILLNGAQHIILLPSYPDLYRTGVNIPKGGFAALKKEGLDGFYNLIDEVNAELGQHVRKHITSWKDLHVLDIFTTHAPLWGKDGLIMIGDAAHTLTPLLGQGVNIAIQDAMTLAPMLAQQVQSDKAVDTQFLRSYQSERQPQVDFVTQMQQRQEKMLCSDSKLMLSMRKAFYFILNRMPFIQNRILNQISYKRQRSLAMGKIS